MRNEEGDEIVESTFRSHCSLRISKHVSLIRFWLVTPWLPTPSPTVTQLRVTQDLWRMWIDQGTTDTIENAE